MEEKTEKKIRELHPCSPPTCYPMLSNQKDVGQGQGKECSLLFCSQPGLL